MDPFKTHTGRAMPLRRAGNCLADPKFVLGRSVYADATILIASPGFGAGSSRTEVARALAGHGFRAVISARFGDIIYNELIQAGIVLAQLPANVVNKLLQIVEADPQISIAIDLGRREVSAGGGQYVVFEIDQGARQRLMTGRDALADLLQAAQRRLASSDLGADRRTRLQRRLVAICDAMKAPGADKAYGTARVKKFLEELDRADGDRA